MRSRTFVLMLACLLPSSPVFAEDDGDAVDDEEAPLPRAKKAAKADGKDASKSSKKAAADDDDRGHDRLDLNPWA
jgi:hypothetical protein